MAHIAAFFVAAGIPVCSTLLKRTTCSYAHLHDRAKARAQLALAGHSRDVVVRTVARRELKSR
jgi:hypothetical protein